MDGFFLLWEGLCQQGRFVTTCHYYNCDGLSIDLDTGDQACLVTLYFIDYDKAGRYMDFSLLDENFDVVAEQHIENYEHGVYVTVEVQGIVTLDVASADNNNGPAAIFFDPVTDKEAQKAAAEAAAAAVEAAAEVTEAAPTLEAREIAADFETRGEWVGKYGNDGYMLFVGGPYEYRPTLEDFTDTAPSYVKGMAYYPHQGGNIWLHDFIGAAAPEDDHSEDGLWTDASKTERFATTCHYYNCDGLSIDLDTGDQACLVTLWFIDYDNGGRVMDFSLLDANSNVVATKHLENYQNGVYVTVEIQGLVTLDVASADNNNGPAAIFFDPVAGTDAQQTAVEETAVEEPAAEAPAVEEPVVEAPVEEAPAEEVVEAAAAPAVVVAPQTFDAGIVAMIAAALSLAGYAVSKKK